MACTTRLILWQYRLHLHFTACGIGQTYSLHFQTLLLERDTISPEHFERVLSLIVPETCCCVSEFANKSNSKWILLTFDDGLVTDWKVVLPALARHNLRGTFFISTENIGRDGYSNIQQLRELTSAGMEIASHGVSHRYLVIMPRSEAFREICESKKRLEDCFGISVNSFAPVGGHYKRWMVDAAAEAGYRVFATMVPGRSSNDGCPLLLRRNHIQAHHTLGNIACLLHEDRRVFLRDGFAIQC